jgi:hypothetical protein
MKGKLIVGLVCLNVLLLAAVVTVNLQQSSAQGVLGAPGEYLMTVGHLNVNQDLVYVTDLGRRYTMAFYVAQDGKSVVPVLGRDLVRDFGRAAK